jgi:glycerol-3-phosphate dehydrogenase
LYGKVYDVAIIGGGLTATAVARDAAGRGLSVFLCDEGDLGGASETAPTSVCGGIEHLAALRPGAMREAVAEREILMRAAPHLARPLTLLIPHHERLWPLGALRLGLFALDHAARSTLPRAGIVHLDDWADGPLQPHFATAVAYADCAADNGRLVVHNAIDARARGTTIHTRMRCTIAEREGTGWRLSLEATSTGERFVALAKLLVNAAGGRAAGVLDHVVHGSGQVRVGYTKQAWLAVRQPGFGHIAYALPGLDGQFVYALPYEGDTVLLGPVTTPYFGNPAAPRVDRADVAYLADIVDQYFRPSSAAIEIVRSFASVDAMPKGPTGSLAAGELVVDAPPRVAPLISVFGGTVAVHRRLAEDVVDRMGRFRPVPPAWTAHATLPGGGYPANGERDIERALRAAYPFVSAGHAARLVRAYGTRASAVLTGARSAANLGRRFGADLTEAEVNYLCQEEWAQTADDILWRRSTLGLALSGREAAGLDRWFGETPARVDEPAREAAF